jgi:hypothetical protein
MWYASKLAVSESIDTQACSKLNGGIEVVELRGFPT